MLWDFYVKRSDLLKKDDIIFDRKDAEFREMCAWIERELFGYDENQKLQTMACLKLQGLRKGKVIGNNHTEDYGNYSVECVFNTFKFYKNTILNALKGKTFSSETAKMGYICAIIRDKINNMYVRMKNAKNNQERRERAALNKVDYRTEHNVQYQRQTEDINNDKFEDMW